MKEQDKKRIQDEYKKAKENGVPFYPDILFKDAVVALIVFLVLVGLAYFLGAPLEERANPADSSYTPRPEWYFLFLFQLLKYFPGNLEVIGVILIPGIVIILLALLPLLDNNPRRHFLDRPWVTGITSVLVVGILALTVLSYLEAPPPAEQKTGDPVAQLYTENCSPCHGPSITVPDGLDLHTIIAQGTHGGMPAWNGDLSTDEIDALAGFITSPTGYDLYRELCLDCHEIPELVATNPIELRDALEQGKGYPPHADLEIPYGDSGLSGSEVNSLLNFLVAPDGQRLFAINCSSCHGESVAFSGSQSHNAGFRNRQRGDRQRRIPPNHANLGRDPYQCPARCSDSLHLGRIPGYFPGRRAGSVHNILQRLPRNLWGRRSKSKPGR
ncbi:MAG: c-type cytochrome [Anaerolineales bacterium]